MTSAQLRTAFLSYFQARGHVIVPSDSLIPSSDSTLLFTSAGMVQFKDNFLGIRKDLSRAASVQKCFRTSDVERVGHTFRHLTFFEMFGNFSFGDYFKAEAIAWAWEFLTREIGLDAQRLYVTVYHDDQEALEIWSKIIPRDRIFKMGQDTNFWRMGDTGPCGPCSEILYDLGKEYGCKQPGCSPACDCDRHLEVWNNVFTQYDQQADGSLKPLAQKNIDTGMGLERLNLVANGFKTVFDTDTFGAIHAALGRVVDLDAAATNHVNAILDHARAAVFVVSEGILPANEGRGYVLRKIIRRGLRYAKLLGAGEPVLHTLVPAVVEVMKPQYPELEVHQEKVVAVVRAEEEKFLETLDHGMAALQHLIDRGGSRVSGEDVFRLYDTFGFPEELVREILQEHGVTYDRVAFQAASEEARRRSRASWRGIEAVKTAEYLQYPETRFVGYDTLSAGATVLAVLPRGDGRVEVVVDTTPLYGESGGQVGDSGVILKNGRIAAAVLDTRKIENRIVHSCVQKDDLAVGDRVEMAVDQDRRRDIMRHHTATHLLHAALRMTVGGHVHQSGSLVSDRFFRFDFMHYNALTHAEIRTIEEAVNERIMACLPVSVRMTDMASARSLGAMALFEEKYGDTVRVVTVGVPEHPYSVELCGGTHVANTGEIGLFRITGESSVGNNLRRIEAVCGRMVYDRLVTAEQRLRTLAEVVNATPEELENKLRKLVKQVKELQGDLAAARLQAGAGRDCGVQGTHKGCAVVIRDVVGADAALLRELGDRLMDEYRSRPALLIVHTTVDDRFTMVIRSSEPAVAKGLSADHVARAFNAALGIKSGGRKDYAQGGGKLQRPPSNRDLMAVIERSV